MEVSACPAECVEYACECSLSLWLELGVEKQGGRPGNDLAVLAMRLATLTHASLNVRVVAALFCGTGASARCCYVDAESRSSS